MSKRDFLKQANEDAELMEAVDVDQVLLSFISALSIVLLGLSTNVLLNFTEVSIGDSIIGIILMIVSFILDYFIYMVLTTRRKIKKRYGENSKEKIKSAICDNCSIEEIKEYYEIASIHFKEEYLDIILVKEIANSLGLKDGYNQLELLKKVGNENTLKIENL